MKAINRDRNDVLGMLQLRENLPPQAIEVRSYADFVPMGASARRCAPPITSSGPLSSATANAEALQIPHSHHG